MDKLIVVKVNDAEKRTDRLLAENSSYAIKSVTAVSDDDLVIVFSRYEHEIESSLSAISNAIYQLDPEAY